MKIAFPLWSLTNRRGGTERAGAELANALAQRGHEVLIFTSGPERLPTNCPLHPDIRIEYNMIHFRLWLNGIEELRRQLHAHKVDVLVGMGSDATLLSYAGMVYGTDTALVMSDRSAPFATGGINWNQPDRLTAFSAADRIHCLLPRYADSFPPCLQARIRHIPNASPVPEYVDTQGYRRAHTPKILLALGRLCDSIKQQSLLIRAFALLRPYFPDWHLHIFGGDFYDEKRELDKLIAQENLLDCAFINDEVQDVTVPLRTASLLCHPSRYEGFPMAVIEAMRCSLPVVGFAQCEALQDILDPSFSRLAPQMTAESLAESLASLMADENSRIACEQHALEASRHYTLKAIVPQWEKLLAEAVQAHKASRYHPSLPLRSIKDIDCNTLPETHQWQKIIRAYLKILKTSKMFDYVWYRNNYVHGPEVMDPLLHYILFGADKGYNPNSWFNTVRYKEWFMADAANMNPLLHYYLFGKEAGYCPSPSME